MNLDEMESRNTNTLISVVIPVFNRSNLIVSAMDSVVSQTYRPIELVVVDDGSTDDTLTVLDQWQRSLVKGSGIQIKVVRQKNSGANAARNKGIVEASGEYIAFLDSDDCWLVDKLSRQWAIFDDVANPGGVYCGLRNVDLATEGRGPIIPRDYPEGNLLQQMLIHDVTAPTSCWLVRKSCFTNVGYFDITLPARQDWDMWIRLSEKYSIGVVPEVLVEMGNHPGERVRSDGNREIMAHQTIFKKYKDLRKRYPFWVSLAARSAMYRRRGRVYFHRNMSTPKALFMQLSAILVWPFNFDSYAALMGIALPENGRREARYFWNRIFGKTRIAIKTH